MEKALRASVDHLREGVQILDTEWRYVYLNAAAAQHGQREQASMLGRTMMECYPGIEGTDVFRLLERVMQSRVAEMTTNEFTYPTGERRTFELVIDPVPAGICVLSLDVTEREAKQAEVRRLEAELHRQRLRVFRATMTTVNDIVNNFLNSLQLVRLEATDGQLSPEMLETFDEMISDTTTRLRRLGDQQQVREKEVAMGLGIDYDEA